MGVDNISEDLKGGTPGLAEANPEPGKHTAAVRAEVLEAQVKAVRLFRVLGEDEFIDEPFDPERHQWDFPLENSQLDSRIELGHIYTLEETYDTLENYLLSDNRLELQRVLSEAVGHGDFAILELRVTRITEGGVNGIFKIDCDISKSGATETISFVATSSKAEALNVLVESDHKGAMAIRADEARDLGLDVSSSDYEEVESFPRHFASCEGSVSEPAFYLAEFADGFAEANARKVVISLGGLPAPFVQIVLNSRNLAEPEKVMDIIDSIAPKQKLAKRLLRLANASGRIVHVSFGAGDPLYNEPLERWKLHTYRDPEAYSALFNDQTGRLLAYLQDAMNDSDGSASSRYAYQILDLVFTFEGPTRDTFTPLSSVNIRDTLEEMYEDGTVRMEEIEEILSILQNFNVQSCLASIVRPGLNIMFLAINLPAQLNKVTSAIQRLLEDLREEP